MADAKRNLTIKFSAIGEKKLIAALQGLAKAQNRLGTTLSKTAKTQHLVNKRVSTNTKLVAANSTALTRAQSVIAVYRNQMLLASFAVGLISVAFIKFVKMAGKQEDSVRRLAAVFGGEAAVELNKYSSELQKNSVYGDENINVLMSQLGAFGANVEQTKALTEATMNLASGLQLDLNTAGLLVAKTIGSTTDALTRYGVGAGGAREKTEKIANVISSVNNKFGDLAEKLGKTTVGQLDKAANAFSDLGEELGRVFAPMVLLVANSLRTIAENLNAQRIVVWTTAIIGASAALKIYNKHLLSSALLNQLLILRLASFKKIIIPYVLSLKSLAVGLFSVGGATRAFAAATVWARTATHALTAAIAMNPIGAIAVALAVAIPLILKFTGVLKEESVALSDDELNLQTHSEAIGASIRGLQRKIDVMKATTDIEKYQAEVIHNLTDAEKDLLLELSATTREYQKQKGLKEDIIRMDERELKKAHEKARETLINARSRRDELEDLIAGEEKLEASAKKSAKAAASWVTEGMKITDQEGNMYDLVDSTDKVAESTKEAFNPALLKEYQEEYRSTANAIPGLAKQVRKAQDAMFEDTPISRLSGALKSELGKMSEELTATEELMGGFVEFSLDKLAKTKDAWVGLAETAIGSLGGIVLAHAQANIAMAKSDAQAEINKLKDTRKYQKASSKQQEQLEKAVKDKHNKTIQKEFKVQQQANAAAVTMDYAMAIMNLWGKFAGRPIAGAAVHSMITAIYLAQLNSINQQKPPTMEYGGLIGGKSHAQGGTMINAERGEFVVSRKGVESIGLETLNRINAGGGGGTTNISFSGNVLSKDFIEDEALPIIKEAIRRGADIGIG